MANLLFGQPGGAGTGSISAPGGPNFSQVGQTAPTIAPSPAPTDPNGLAVDLTNPRVNPVASPATLGAADPLPSFAVQFKATVADQQTVFTLPSAPTSPANVFVGYGNLRGGMIWRDASSGYFTVAGNVLTWEGPALWAGDNFIISYT